ncbi:hypothetical protein [Thiomonas sp. FB-Cd]|uniref:hypothetical protein n=1 Tax=Thiomonas sp. FB-Cd TaxID=1158292 RepID=UPI0004DF7B83|nr:hypothetical protein [Thiomonas sp. FB-Cd]
MKKNTAPDLPFFDSNSTEGVHQPNPPSGQAIDPREASPGFEGGLPPIQDGNATNVRRSSKYRASVKMLEENWEGENTIRSTTRARNMEIFDIVQRRAINEIAKGDPEVETAITMPQIIEHFIADTMAGRYSKPSYARYRTALMSEMNIQLRALGDAGEMSEYIEAIAALSQKSTGRIQSSTQTFRWSIRAQRKRSRKKELDGLISKPFSVSCKIAEKKDPEPCFGHGQP